ncbi:MAG TPA: sodium:calcium antiporter [Patescibacteria group bacterium]|nr:sodium:calcium antiporter [Patescibacteria group bacterium]
MLETYGVLLGGLLLVMLGADAFLKGASGFAQGRGVGGSSAGLAIVAVGASVSELAIAVVAIVRGHDALAVGTVIGSCIANLGLIIGVSALVKPLSTGFRLVGVALPILIAAAVALLLMGQDGALGQFDGSLLLLAAAAFGWLAKRAAAQESEAVRKELAYAANTQTELLRNLARILVGVLLLGYGAWWSVGGAIDIAAHFRMNELWVGLSVLAIGAALPELATSVVAAHRGHGNVVVGSAIASSVVNLLLVIGLLALGRPIALSTSLLHLEIPALLAFSLAFFPMIRGDAVVSRREGLILVLAFAGWMLWLLLPRF